MTTEEERDLSCAQAHVRQAREQVHYAWSQLYGPHAELAEEAFALLAPLDILRAKLLAARDAVADNAEVEP